MWGAEGDFKNIIAAAWALAKAWNGCGIGSDSLLVVSPPPQLPPPTAHQPSLQQWPLLSLQKLHRQQRLSEAGMRCTGGREAKGWWVLGMKRGMGSQD